MKKVLAFDFGASSGRAVLGEYENGKLNYSEIHRFENNPITQDGKLCWDFYKLLDEVHLAIEKTGKVDSIAFDTWGVDYGLLDEDGKLMSLPVCYRDKRTKGAAQNLYKKMCAQKMYAETGTQIMDINTLMQLSVEDLGSAKKLLFMPDLFAHALCGNAVCEQTIASTSQLLNPKIVSFSDEIFKTFEIEKSLFSPLVKSGTVIGEYKGAKVIAVAGHDTQSAVVAIPSLKEDVAFLSCGTWSLLGAELASPILTEESYKLGFSNEIGADGKINYLTNITGLWLIQECKRHWKKEGHDYSFAQLEQMARECTSHASIIDVDAEIFAQPGNMPQKIIDYCEENKQTAPVTVGEFCSCIYHSLAHKYADKLRKLSEITGKNFKALHMLGGGIKATLLCKLTAKYCKIPVYAGPIEATAIGNIIMQLIALKEIKNIAHGRKIIKENEIISKY